MCWRCGSMIRRSASPPAPDATRRCPPSARKGARDPLLALAFGRRAARRGRASRHRAAVAEHGVAGRLFPAGAAHAGQQGGADPGPLPGQGHHAVHGSGLRHGGVPLRPDRRAAEILGPDQPSLYLGFVLYALRHRLLRHQRPRRRAARHRARSDDPGPAQRCAGQRGDHGGGPPDRGIPDQYRPDRDQGAGGGARTARLGAEPADLRQVPAVAAIAIRLSGAPYSAGTLAAPRRLRAERQSANRCTTTKNAGTNRTARQVEASMPENTVMPMDLRALAPAPVASTSGSTLRMKAKEVIRIGRKRACAPAIAASKALTPCAWRSRATSTIRMAFLADSAISSMMPIWT